MLLPFFQGSNRSFSGFKMRISGGIKVESWCMECINIGVWLGFEKS